MIKRIRVSEPWRQLFVAVVAFALGVIARVGVHQLIGVHLQWLTFFPAIIAASLFGGVLAGLLATMLSATAPVYWPKEIEIFQMSSLEDFIGLGLFVVTSLFIVAMAWLVNRAQRQRRCTPPFGRPRRRQHRARGIGCTQRRRP